MKKIKIKKIYKKYFLFLFVVYLLFLLRVVFFKYPLHETFQSLKGGFSAIHLSVNLVPFATILNYIEGEPTIRIAVRNLLGNILIFLPFGLILPLIWEKIRSFKNIIISASVFSLSIEIIQLVFRLGSFDIDDLILNALGAAIGFYLINKFVLIKDSKEEEFEA